MRKIQLLIAIATIFLSCSSEKERSFDFDPNGKTLVRLNIINCKEPKSYDILNNQTLPLKQTIENINFNKDTIFELELETHYPTYISLYSNRESVDFFVIPSDTLNISLDYQKGVSLKKVIGYVGKTAIISEYLTKYRKSFFGAPSKTQTPESFNQELDSFYSPSFKVLDSLLFAKALPKWFVEIEKENISCERDWFKLLQYHQRVSFYNNFIPKGETLKNQLDLGRLKYFWLDNSCFLFGSFCPDKYDTLTQKYATKEVLIQHCQDNIDEIYGKISAKALSYFVANRISQLFYKNKLLELSPNEFSSYTKQIDEFIEKNSQLITDTLISNFIIREKNKKLKEYNDLNILSVGDVVPNFYLEDINGQNVNLSDFKGKVVLLNFWGTYCVPCIKSIPEKNKIVDELKQVNFALVNICINNNISNWKEIVKDNKFEGIHLICKGNWKDILSLKYQISGVPHYTLIDKKGQLLKNNLKDSIEYYIKKSL